MWWLKAPSAISDVPHLLKLRVTPPVKHTLLKIILLKDRWMLHVQGSDTHKPKCKGVPDQRVPNLVPYFIPLLLAFTRPGIQVQLWFTGSAAQLHCQRVFPLHSVGQSTFTQEKKKKAKAQRLMWTRQEHENTTPSRPAGFKWSSQTQRKEQHKTVRHLKIIFSKIEWVR